MQTTGRDEFSAAERHTGMIRISGKNTFRGKRIRPLLDIIRATFLEHGSVRIIDIGGTRKYWNILPGDYLKKHNVKITIANLMDDQNAVNDDTFEFITCDACDLRTIEDNAFHIAHSNSVIEHVGDWKRMIMFSNEVRRVAPKYFIQTPNFWFPLEPHCMTPFFHWLPKPARIRLVSNFRLGNWRKADSTREAVRIVESARLLNKAMFSELFREAEVSIERLCYLPKSFVAIKP